MTEKNILENNVRESRFPPSLFFVYLIVLFLMSGIHTGLIVGRNALNWSDLTKTVIPLMYWSAVAVGLTLFTRKQIKRVYEEPMHKLAEATKKVAEGDFSIYIPPLHTSDKLDYMDKMIVDFFSNVSHEIKTPIAIIQNNAELLCSENLSGAQKKSADLIYHTAKRLADLISNILKLNKLENSPGAGSTFTVIIPVTKEEGLS